MSASNAQALRQLPAHIPNIARRLRPLGELQRDRTLPLTLVLAYRNGEELDTLLKNLYNPAHPLYRRFLSPAEFNRRFCPTEADYQQVSSFATNRGLEIAGTSANRTLLYVKGSVETIQKAFHTSIQTFRHPQEDRVFFAPDKEPSIPDSLPLLSITGLDNVFDPVAERRRRKNPPPPVPNAGSGPAGGFIATDLRNAYIPNVSLDGSGQVIGIVSLLNYALSDIKLYASQSGGPDPTIENVQFSGFDPKSAAAEEDTLDISMALAFAPRATIVVYSFPGSDFTTLLNEIADPSKGRPLALQISTSYSLNYGVNNANEAIFKRIASQGQSFFGSSGDDGAFLPDSRGGDFPPNDSEYVTSVGGTVMTTQSPGGPWSSEVAWSSSGGGYGWFNIQSWQQNAVNSTNNASPTLRNCPDVAITASAEIFFNGASTVEWGTSVASPLWASFTALVNQQAKLNTLPSVGFLNPTLYAIGQNPAEYALTFHDITSGSNATYDPNSFMAVTGYDLVTGWGSPKGISLINALALRKPFLPVLTAVTVQYVSQGRCDPGPRALQPVTFRAVPNGGLAPFTYVWESTLGGASTSPTITVTAPATNQDFTLTVTITDAAGETAKGSGTFTAKDPTFAGLQARLCTLIENLDRFRPPIYVNPGDPGPEWHSRLNLEKLLELSNAMKASVEGLQKLLDK